MPAANLTPADDAATLPQNNTNGYNEAYQNNVTSNNSTGVQYRMTNNTSDATRTAAFMRFPKTPTDPTIKTSLRSARLIFPLSSGNATDDAHFGVKGWKVAAGGGRLTLAGTSTAKPSYYYLNQGTTATLRVDLPDANTAANGKPYALPDTGGNLLAIIQEIMGQGSWNPGDAITLLFLADNTAPFSGTDFRISAAINDITTYPALVLEWGAPTPPDPQKPEYDQLLAGDSGCAYHDQPGGEKDFTFPVFMPNVIFKKAPLGESGDNALAGSIYGGDRIRGLSANGMLYDIIKEKYGASINPIQQGFAIADTTAQAWANDVSNATGGMWGAAANVNSLRYRLAHPVSNSSKQIIKLSLGANDMLFWGKSDTGSGGLLLYHDNVSYWTSTWLPQWQAKVTQIQGWIDTCINHILSLVPDTSKVWIWLPGYWPLGNHSINRGTSTVAFANGNSQQYQRQIHAAQGAGIGYAQYAYDGGAQTTHTDFSGPLAQQSAAVQFAADYQQKNYPADAPGGVGSESYNPGAASWGFCLGGINFPALGPLSNSTWNYTVGSGGTAVTKSGWEVGLRNVTDVTINRVMRLLDPAFAALDTAYSQVVYTPAWDVLPNSPYSADPTSTYAAADPTYSPEGIHLSKIGVRAWYTAEGGPVDQMTAAIPSVFGPLAPFTPFATATNPSLSHRPGFGGQGIGVGGIRTL